MKYYHETITAKKKRTQSVYSCPHMSFKITQIFYVLQRKLYNFLDSSH